MTDQRVTRVFSHWLPLNLTFNLKLWNGFSDVIKRYPDQWLLQAVISKKRGITVVYIQKMKIFHYILTFKEFYNLPAILSYL
jgi:hypothetical protein